MEPPDLQTYRPPAGHPLEPHVLAIFRVRAEVPYRHETILPKGNVDLLFNLGETIHGDGIQPDTYVAGQGAAWVGGLRTQAYHVCPRGRLYLMGVCLRADACAALLPLSPAEVVNLDAPDVPASAAMRTLAAQLYDARTFADQCALLMRWLAARLRPPRGADVVRHACALLRRSRSEDAVRQTARALSVSPRHLRRLLGEQVGVGPAEYVRLARFVSATRQMGVPGRTLTQVALACGYYDQAHFCRDFRAFAGMTPQEFRPHANGPVAGHIFQA